MIEIHYQISVSKNCEGKLSDIDIGKQICNPERVNICKVISNSSGETERESNKTGRERREHIKDTIS